jgi:transcriptional regulator with XRE-family HTH domain
VNARLIVRRRLELGLSRADLARLTGLTWTMLTLLEGTVEPPFVTLDAARRLANALAVDLNVIADKWPPTRSPGPDDVCLERLLASSDGIHAHSELALALEWPLPRVIEAAEHLDHRLVGTGQAVRTTDRGIQLTIRGANHGARAAARLRSRHTRPTKRQAELLRLIILGGDRRSCGEHLDDHQRADAAELSQQGLIEPYRDHLRLTDHARYSLEPEIRQTPTPSVIRGLDYPAAETPGPDRTITRRGRISGLDSSPRRLRAQA